MNKLIIHPSDTPPDIDNVEIVLDERIVPGNWYFVSKNNELTPNFAAPAGLKRISQSDQDRYLKEALQEEAAMPEPQKHEQTLEFTEKTLEAMLVEIAKRCAEQGKPISIKPTHWVGAQNSSDSKQPQLNVSSPQTKAPP